jgi:LPXTG-site transpeptidase (sortase) family protein
MTQPGPNGGQVPTPPGSPAGQAKKGRHPAVLPTLLIAGSLGGVAVIMAGLLTFLAPPADEPMLVAAPESRSTVGIEQAAEPVALPEVGPGGPGVPLTPAEPSAPPPLPAVRAEPPVETAESTRPTRVMVPAIGLSARLSSLGLQKNREIEVPPLSQPKLAGWYRLGPVPGEIGPAVILGHVNNRQGPAVFANLRKVKRGHKIQVERTDGKVLEFTVDGVEMIKKKAFPTKRVYGNQNDASLRLITCGGVFDARRHSYTDNIIVYATLSKRTR